MAAAQPPKPSHRQSTPPSYHPHPRTGSSRRCPAAAPRPVTWQMLCYTTGDDWTSRQLNDGNYAGVSRVQGLLSYHLQHPLALQTLGVCVSDFCSRFLDTLCKGWGAWHEQQHKPRAQPNSGPSIAGGSCNSVALSTCQLKGQLRPQKLKQKGVNTWRISWTHSLEAARFLSNAPSMVSKASYLHSNLIGN